MTPLTRVKMIESLRICEDRLRVIRQELEEEGREEFMAKILKERRASVG